MSYFAFALFRLCNVLLASTWFVPDEIFQSVEVAYNWVFGVGYLSWEWHPTIALRSAVHPAIYATVFQLLKQINADFNWLIYWAPNFINALFFAAADVCYLSFLKRFFRFNRKAVMPAMALYLTNWFVLYCATRSLSNTLETVLMIISLKWYTFGEIRHKSRLGNGNTHQSRQYFSNELANNDEERRHLDEWRQNYDNDKSFDNVVPFGTSCTKKNSIQLTRKIQELKSNYGDVNSQRIVICLATLAVLIRPTALLIFAPLCGIQFLESSSKFSYIFKVALPCSLAVVALVVYIDRLYYGGVTFALFNFIYFNVFQGGSAQFGSHVWHWYATNGLTAIITLLFLPLFTYFLRLQYHYVFGSNNEDRISAWWIPSRFFWTGIGYVLVHSAIAHKEHRFLLPVIPLLIPSLLAEIENYPRLLKKYFKALVILINIGLAIYFGLIHQRGPNHAARIVLREVANHSRLHGADVESFYVAQLMPCFAMPQYVRFHTFNDIMRIRMLDCTPYSAQLNIRELEKTSDGSVEEDNDELIKNEKTSSFNYHNSIQSESDVFEADALGWLRANWHQDELLRRANVVVAFERTYRRLEAFLAARGFVETKNIFHAHVTTSDYEDMRIVIAIRQHENDDQEDNRSV